MNDTIADMLTRLRNAAAVHKSRVHILHSKVNEAVIKILVDEGYVRGYSLIADAHPHPLLDVELKYIDDVSVLTHIERVSKSGRRIYVKRDDITPVLAHQGISILTTSQGIMTGSDARKKGVGGEILCQIW